MKHACTWVSEYFVASPLVCFRAGWTCLHYASYHGHANVVVELLRFAASKGFLRALINRKVRCGVGLGGYSYKFVWQCYVMMKLEMVLTLS